MAQESNKGQQSENTSRNKSPLQIIQELNAEDKKHFPDLHRLDLLEAPFRDVDLEWRVQSSGFTERGPWIAIVPYVDARAIMTRLDRVMGRHRWTCDFEQWNGGVKCRISLLVEGRWIHKEDGSGETQIEAFKGGFSKALVRCAVHWGMGRYLYDTPRTYGTIVEQKTKRSISSKLKNPKTGKDVWVNWEPPLFEKK